MTTKSPEALDLDALEKLARKATKAPWAQSGDGDVCALSDQANEGFVIAECHGPERDDNSDYILGAQPKHILALIARVREAEAKLRERGEAVAAR